MITHQGYTGMVSDDGNICFIDEYSGKDITGFSLSVSMQ